MRKATLVAFSAAAVVILSASSTASAASPFAGRWDLTIKTPHDTYPSWMEFTENGGQPELRVVGRVASVHPARDIKVNGNHLTFTTSEYFGKQIEVTWDVSASGRKLSGKQHRADGVTGDLTGVPAPALNRKPPARWSEAKSLFDGKDLSGWHPDDPSKNHWKAIDGDLVNESAGANIQTDQKFQDFKLHIEYNCPQDGNSGVYLRGRYEVQVEYEPPDANDKYHGMGSIYGFIAPSATLPKKPGQWETYDIELVGRTVTVHRDGTLTIDHQEIPGITGGALNSREADPGPLYIQGDHTGGMKYRNIRIQLPAK